MLLQNIFWHRIFKILKRYLYIFKAMLKVEISDDSNKLKIKKNVKL